VSVSTEVAVVVHTAVCCVV